MDALQHPAFQSLLLPALLSAACLGALGLMPGGAHRATWWPLGAALGLVLAFSVWPGFDWPAPAPTPAQRVPWVALAALLAVALAQAWRGAAARPPGAPPADATGAAGALGVALFGLAGLAVLAASLLLAQLALMVAVATAVLGLWAWGWPRSGLRVSAAALLPLASAGLALAAMVAASGRVPWGAWALLALSQAVPWAFPRRGAARPAGRWRPLVVALIAALPVLAALAWAAFAPPGASATPDDPYYTPRW